MQRHTGGVELCRVGLGPGCVSGTRKSRSWRFSTPATCTLYDTFLCTWECILLLCYEVSIAVMLLLLMFLNASNATFNTFCCTRKYIIVPLKACNASHPDSQCLLLHPAQGRTHPLLSSFRTCLLEHTLPAIAIFFTAEKWKQRFRIFSCITGTFNLTLSWNLWPCMILHDYRPCIGKREVQAFALNAGSTLLPCLPEKLAAK